ncbi:hypothetical protein vBCbaSRXM_109 [Citromicrobium phage vB_CbaS-RXM]|nr:hypothetical protein vBCbaSRXM_109 [Citromicrobium phage vB_CbaS-RXM]
MGDLLRIEPELHFPKLTVFETGDQFNTERGRYFFRDVQGALHGPFKSKLKASLELLRTCPTSGAPMRTPFQHDGMWWWKKDTASGVSVEGPYEYEGEAETSIINFMDDLRDKANQ